MNIKTNYFVATLYIENTNILKQINLCLLDFTIVLNQAKNLIKFVITMQGILIQFICCAY